jgi:hypothetical protein
VNPVIVTGRLDPTIFNGGVTERREVEPGACEESLEEAGPVLHPPEPGPGQRGQLAKVAFDQVSQGPLEC